MPHTVQWLGHAACRITSQEGTVILIDPWLTENPRCPVKAEEIKKVDIILVTHDHFDHLGSDIPALVERTGATVIAQPELAQVIQWSGVKSENIIFGIGMNIGCQVAIKDVKITMTQAFHSSKAGTPVGYILTMLDGKSIYHAGDTGIFSDMSLLGEIYNIDLALVPIGGVFVMDPVQAAYSLSLLKPKMVVPIHYATFPILVQNADEFITLASQKAFGVQVKALKPGEQIEL